MSSTAVSQSKLELPRTGFRMELHNRDAELLEAGESVQYQELSILRRRRDRSICY